VVVVVMVMMMMMMVVVGISKDRLKNSEKSLLQFHITYHESHSESSRKVELRSCTSKFVFLITCSCDLL
jgi:hypothetical protein